jgi:hypothetical protein
MFPYQVTNDRYRKYLASSVESKYKFVGLVANDVYKLFNVGENK